MHVKIQGGGDGVYANSGSCLAAAMYCEHERQELMKKGMNPVAFFHQYSDFVSTREVIERIDNNKKKLRKEDAKFFVLTVSPSADEQRKMGHTLEERIAAFKNYIRNGVMSEYAKNFGRGLSADDIMYYAYVHVERGMKTDEQMHAHIIISRRNMDNSISLSPQSNHRSGKGVIAHGFDRDSFYAKCEHVFDNMLSYSRPVEESYEYRNAMKNGTFQDVANVTAKAAELEYGVDLSDWVKLIRGELEKESTTVTAKPQYTEPVVDETVVPVQHTTETGIVGFAKKAWNFASGLFGKKTTVPPSPEQQQKEPQTKEEPKLQIANKEPEPVQPVLSAGANTTAVDLYKEGDLYILAMIKNGKLRANNSVERADAEMFFKAKNDGNTKQFYRVCAYLEDKYLKNVPGQDIPEKMQQQLTAQEQKSVQSVPEADKRVKVTMDVYYSKATDSYSVIARHGQLYRLYNNIDEADAYRFMNDKKSGDMEQFNEVCRYLYGKYLKNVPDSKMTDKEQKPQSEQNKIPDGLRIFKLKVKEHYSAALYKDGKRVRFVDKVDKEDVSMFFKAKNSGSPDLMKKVTVDLTSKYFLVPLAKQIADDFLKVNKNENITSVNARRNHHGYCWIKHEVDGEWRQGYRIPEEFTHEINSLPTKDIEFVINCINNLLIGAFPTVSCSGASTHKKRKRDENKGRTR